MDSNSILDKINDLFSKMIMKNISLSDFEDKLGQCLTVLSNGKKEFKCSVLKVKTSEPFFLMQTFPYIEDMDVFLKGVTEEPVDYKGMLGKWQSLNHWYIEIDSRCFDRNELSFTPAELTSMVLHEVGHSVYSDRVVEKFYRAYRETYAKMKSIEKDSMKIMYMLLMIPLSTACINKAFTTNYNEESKSDKYVKNLGYGDTLKSAMEKILKSYGNSMVKTDTEELNLIKSDLVWATLNTMDLTRRKNKLKDDLFLRCIRSGSNFLKNVSHAILNKLGINTYATYTGSAVESTIELINEKDFVFNYKSDFDAKVFGSYERRLDALKSNYEVGMESILFGGKKPKLPTQYDIDALYVEIDRIENNHDRIFVLDLVYNLLDKITAFEEYYEVKDPNTLKRVSVQIESFKKELNDIRLAALAKKDFKKSYKLFVEVPAGYEG